MTEEEINKLKEEDSVENQTIIIEKEEEEEKESKKKYLILLLLLLLLLLGFFTVRVGLGSDLYNSITDRIVSIFAGGRPSAPVITGGSETWASERLIKVEKDSKTKDKLAYYEYCIATKDTTKDCEWKKTETKNVKIVKTGIYYVTFRGVDSKEQRSLNSNTEVAYIDNSNPVISNIEVKEIKTDSVNIEVKAKDEHSGVKAYQYSLDNKNYVDGKTSYTFNKLKKNTTYTLYIKVIDKVGNFTILSMDVKTLDEDKCTLNCDTNGDNICDLNCDTDGDNVCDLNCDTDSDGKCDLYCDTDGDGKCDNGCDIPNDKPNVDIEDENDNNPEDDNNTDNKDDEDNNDDISDKDNEDDDNKEEDKEDDNDEDDDTVDEEEKVEIPEINLNEVPVEFIYGDTYKLPSYVSFGKDTGTYECIVEGTKYKDTSTIPMGEHLIVCTAISSKNIKTMVEKTVKVVVGKGEEEIWDGWIKLNLYYPDNSTNWEWRLGKEGEVRTGYDNTDWQAYTGPILVKLDDVDDIYIRYDINGETFVIAPNGKAAVSIEPESYSLKSDTTTKVAIYYDALATTKEYRIDNGDWQEYKGEFEVGPNTIIDARVTKEEKVYDSEGTYLYTDKTSNSDQVFISKIVETTDEEDGGGSGTTVGGVTIGTTVTAEGETITTITGEYTPTTYLKGPVISTTPSSTLTESVKVKIRPEEVADKIYVSVGYGKYEEYTDEFEVTQNTIIKAYYIRYKDGKTSDISYYYVQNIKEPNLPYVKISASPSNFLSEIQDEVKVTITGSDYEKLEYSFDGVIYKEYTEELTIKESTTIYAKGTNSEGVKVERLTITTTTPPVVKEELSIHIELDPDKERVEGLTNETKVEITYDKKATKKYYKLGYYGTWKEYTEPFIVNSNTTIYSYCISEDGKGTAQKTVDYLTTGISDPVIKANPTTSSPQVKIEITYDSNAEITRYQIGNGALLDYNGPFYVYENTTIKAYNKNALGYEATSEYIVSNISTSPKYTYLDMGSYYIIKLNYPEASTEDEREYKWKEAGTWKKYDNNGILLIKPEYKDEIITSDGIKVTDNNGKEIVFTDHYYLLDVPMSKLMENLFMRWDTGKISAPKIYVSPKTDPTREVEVNISYPSGSVQKLYKIVTPDGNDTGWLVNNGTFTVSDNNAVIYAKGVTINKTDSEIASVKVTNIDDEAPTISYVADLVNPKQKVTVKVTVKDNMAIDKIKWYEGEQTKEFFKKSGNSIVNNGTFTVNKNGKYTIYATDKLGNSTIEVIEITNIDKNAPNISIDVLTKEYGTTAKVSIDYGDSTLKQYSLGNNTSYKEYTDIIEILANDVLNLVNDDGTLTIYAKGTDEAGNVTEVSELVYVLDLDAPASPIIHAASGYPTLTEYGVKLTDKSYIVYDNRNDILNYYSVDNGETWKIYEGPFEITSGTILAKSVKKVSGLTITSKKTVDMPSDALGPEAYDSSETTAYTFDSTSKKLYISEEMIGKSFRIKATGKYDGTTILIKNSSGDNLYSKNLGWLPGTIDEVITIPSNASYIQITVSYRGADIYHIEPYITPVITNTKFYPILTEYGVTPGYNSIKINYFQTSSQRMYRINDGAWKIYEDKSIRLEIGQKIEVKGIDKYGRETPIATYTAVLPSDALGQKAYDKDDETSEVLGYNNNKKIYISSELIGKKVTIYTYLTYFQAHKIAFYDSNNNVLATYQLSKEDYSSTSKFIRENYSVPNNTAYLMYIDTLSHRDPCNIHEISVYKTPIITDVKYYPTLTEYGVQHGYNTVTLTYFSTSVERLYRIDNGEWLNYEDKPIKLEIGQKIEAKGIDKYQEETLISSYTATLPSDALEPSAYDSSDTSSHTFSTTSKKLYISKEMIGNSFRIKATGKYDGTTIKIVNTSGTTIYSKNLGWLPGTIDESITIPDNSSYIQIDVNYRGADIYEIEPYNTPVMSNTKHYPLLTKDGVQQAYNMVTIKYFQTSVKKLYRINSGEWQIYPESAIRLDINSKIEAKGIDKNGVETKISTYTASIPSDALNATSYDNDNSTGHTFNTTSKKIYISSEMIGQKFNINIVGKYEGTNIRIKNTSGTNLYSKNLGWLPGTFNGNITIPDNASYIQIDVNYRGATVYEISPVVTSTTSDESLSSHKSINPHISIDTVALSDKKIVTIEYPEGYTNEYSLDLGNTWLPYEGSITVNKSSVILARTIDGDEIISSSSFTITSIASSETNEEEISISLDELPDRILVGSNYKLPTSVTGSDYICTYNNETITTTEYLEVGNYDIICTVKSENGSEKTVSKQIEVYKEESEEVEGEENE